MQSETQQSTARNEELLVVLWREVLNAPDASGESNFFELGGDSLQMMTLLFRISQDMAVELDPGIVFDNPTPTALAPHISAGQQTSHVSEGLI